MKKLMLTAFIAASLYVPIAMADDNPADSDTAHPGAYVKDSVITASKVTVTSSMRVLCMSP